MSSDFIRNAGASALWRGDGTTRRDEAIDVEDTAWGFLQADGGIGVMVRVAWASHQSVDTTRVAFHGDDGMAELRTTFGLSPRRWPTSTVTVRRHGEETVTRIPNLPGGEYSAQLRAIGQALDSGTQPPGVLAEIRAMATVMESMYASAGRPVAGR